MLDLLFEIRVNGRCMISIIILLKKNFDAELLFTDTDSLTYKMKSENVYEEFLSGKICLTLVIIQKIKSFSMRLIKKLLIE